MEPNHLTMSQTNWNKPGLFGKLTWASDAMLHFSKSEEETNSSTSWMAWAWVHFQQMYILEWTTALKKTKTLSLIINIIAQIQLNQEHSSNGTSFH